jgi:uncharacterized protein YlxP (DUF503 family)
MSAGTGMTVAERLELCKQVRQRAKVAKLDVIALAARHIADIEKQLTATYSSNNPAWAEVTAKARKLVAEADAEVAAMCTAMGILPEFRPRLNVDWYQRGENAIKERRAELRRAAQAELDSRVKLAHAEIERHSLRQSTELSAGLISSDEARAFLASMPSIDDLLPPVMLPAPRVTMLPSGER